jgi:U3 small nucleolar RNA-associated protein 12
LADDVLALTYTADASLLCAALLDHTVQVYRSEGETFFLSLYGHRLPVLCCDATSDGALLITGSSDKNVKVWGLDFGDCHRSMFAHADAVMCVRAQPRTHYFFSGGKDGQIKYWDADSGELVLLLRAHAGAVWSMAASSRRTTDAADVPMFIVSGGADRSLRVWQRSDEPVFVDEQVLITLVNFSPRKPYQLVIVIVRPSCGSRSSWMPTSWRAPHMRAV